MSAGPRPRPWERNFTAAAAEGGLLGKEEVEKVSAQQQASAAEGPPERLSPAEGQGAAGSPDDATYSPFTLEAESSSLQPANLQRAGAHAPHDEQAQRTVMSEADAPAAPLATDDSGAAEAGGLRDDQVQSAVQFLTHPKVQAASVQDRKNFLVKKGLTQAEIDEAIRQAHPQMEQQQPTTRARGGASGLQPAPGLFAEPATGTSPAPNQRPPPPRLPPPPRQVPSGPMRQQLPVPSPAPAPPSGSWAKVVLASMAVAGVGGGLGLLARKVLRKEGDPLGSLFGGGERAASTAAAAVCSVWCA
jgi:hypothetical protein